MFEGPSCEVLLRFKFSEAVISRAQGYELASRPQKQDVFSVLLTRGKPDPQGPSVFGSDWCGVRA